MKIRPSLRIYVLLAMLLTGISTILILSALSVHYFISGMEVGLRDAMNAQAQQQQVSDGNPITVQEFSVATRWQDLSLPIQDNIELSDVEFNTLSKKIIGGSLFSPPKAGYFVMKVMKGEEVRYVSAILVRDGNQIVRIEGVPHFVIIFFTALAGIILFTLILVLVMRKVASPVEKLKSWAKTLDKDKLAEPVPDFHYSELNTLANIVKSSLSSVQESLEREQQFLGYASHELRTPIAVTRTNGELLQKLITKGKSPEKQLEVLERIQRAGLTMTDLTETLLWLNRREGKDLPVSGVQLGLLTQQLAHDLEFLIQGKSVEVQIETDDSIHELPETLCRIIIANLIRNAFQHTVDGKVMIEQSGIHFMIVNQNLPDASRSDDLGFGLGLELTERLIEQYKWKYESTELASGKKVIVNFRASEALWDHAR